MCLLDDVLDVLDVLIDGRGFHTFCVIDEFSQECLANVANQTMPGTRGARKPDRIAERR
jgi:hypothetical protein